MAWRDRVKKVSANSCPDANCAVSADCSPPLPQPEAIGTIGAIDIKTFPAKHPAEAALVALVEDTARRAKAATMPLADPEDAAFAAEESAAIMTEGELPPDVIRMRAPNFWAVWGGWDEAGVAICSVCRRPSHWRPAPAPGTVGPRLRRWKCARCYPSARGGARMVERGSKHDGGLKGVEIDRG